MYGGELFSTFLNISEANLAKAYSMPVKEIENMLLTLEKLNLIIYDKQKDRPQITFLTSRFDSQTLPLQVLEINRKKQRSLQKAKAVRHYTEHPDRCRTQLLLEYFGEISDIECGICDNCLKRKKQEKQSTHNEVLIKNTQQKIVQLLSNGAMSLSLIVQIMQPINEALFREILREMIGEGIVSYDFEGNLVLSKHQ